MFTSTRVYYECFTVFLHILKYIYSSVNFKLLGKNLGHQQLVQTRTNNLLHSIHILLQHFCLFKVLGSDFDSDIELFWSADSEEVTKDYLFKIQIILSFPSANFSFLTLLASFCFLSLYFSIFSSFFVLSASSFFKKN